MGKEVIRFIGFWAAIFYGCVGIPIFLFTDLPIAERIEMAIILPGSFLLALALGLVINLANTDSKSQGHSGARKRPRSIPFNH